jgi:sortase A
MLVYPFLSDWIYSMSSSAVISSYQSDAAELDAAQKKAILDRAKEYNESLNQSRIQLTDPFEVAAEDNMEAEYNSLLATPNNDIMCFVDIPSIHVYLPVYHGTSDAVLEKGAGHIQGTSLPIGGENTHTGISAHTGVNAAKMFTDLVELQEGDMFYLHTLGDILAYQVDDIKVVLPVEMGSLNIQPGEDLCTLITCTPYGVNSHRLLVRGHRVPYDPSAVELNEPETEVSGSQSKWVQEWVKAACSGLGIVFGVVAVVIASKVLSGNLLHKKRDA